MTPGYPPEGVFRGKNIMTPNVLGYFKLDNGWAELSQGTGIYNEPIFGVTVRRHNGERFKPDPSKLHHSKQDALDYIEELS